MADIVIADPRGDADFEQYVRVEVESFGDTTQNARRWIARSRAHAIWRLARAGDEVIGGYIVQPAGQLFGGRSVPAHPVAGVVVAPEWRHRGVAGAMMRDLVAISAERGVAVAPLHAATTRLYRRWGWELGDRSVRHRVRSSLLATLSGQGQAARLRDNAAVEALRREVLHRWDGPLDRPDWWLDVEWPLGEDDPEHHTYGWFEDGRLTGVTRYEESRDGLWIAIRVQELVAATRDAFTGLLGFLGGHEAQAPEITFVHSALRHRSELLFLLPDADKAITTEGHLCWMQRIVDVRAALEGRGWPAHVDARLELEVTDPVRSEPQRCVLEVAGGSAHVSPGGGGAVRCGIGMLSSWYSGTLRTHDAVRLGLLEASAEDQATMDSLIGDREAWMPDFF